MASFKHDSQGFLVGELLDVNRELLAGQTAGMAVWRGIRSDVKAIARALGVQARTGARAAKAQLRATSDSGQRASAKAAAEGIAKAAAGGPSRDASGRFVRQVVMPAGRAGARAEGDGAGPQRRTPSAAERAARSASTATVTTAGRSRVRSAGLDRAATPDAADARDSMGRFTGGGKGGQGDGGTSDRGENDAMGLLTNAIGRLGDSIEGADQLDPTITAMKEVKDAVSPLGRGMFSMFGRTQERKKEAWYKRLLKAITGKKDAPGGGMGGREAVQSGSFMGTLMGELAPKVMLFLMPVLTAIGGILLGGLALLGGVKLGEFVYKWLTDSGLMAKIFDAIDTAKQVISDVANWGKKKYDAAKEAVVNLYDGGKSKVKEVVSDFQGGMDNVSKPSVAPFAGTKDQVLDASGRDLNDPRRLDQKQAVGTDGRAINDPRRTDLVMPENPLPLPPATSIAEQAGRAAGSVKNAVNTAKEWALGKTSERFESGGKGAGTVSTGKGDNGGASYGTYQLSSKAGTLNEFMKLSGYASQFAGLKPGTPEFNAKWKEVAKNDPTFGGAQHDFIKKTHYDPMVQSLKKDGLDVEERGAALKDAVWSTSTQFGGNSKLIKNALKGKDASKMTDAEIISSVQDYKTVNNDSLFSKSSVGIRAGTLGRATSEKAALLKLDLAGASTTVMAGAARIPPVSIPSSVPERIAPAPDAAIPAQLNSAKQVPVNVSMREPIGQDVGDRSIAHVVSGGLGMMA